MIGIKIKSSKDFMNHFLMTDAFADFLFVEGKVITANTYVLDGHMQKDFFDPEEWEDETICPYEFAKWTDMKQMIFQMIKGKHTPVYMRITLQQKPELTRQYLEGKIGAGDQNLIGGLLCTVKYEKGQVTLTTGVAYNGFLPDKEPEKGWDQQMLKMLSEKGLDYEV